MINPAFLKSVHVVQGERIGEENAYFEGQVVAGAVLSCLALALALDHPRDGNVGAQAEPDHTIVWTLGCNVSLKEVDSLEAGLGVCWVAVGKGLFVAEHVLFQRWVGGPWQSALDKVVAVSVAEFISYRCCLLLKNLEVFRNLSFFLSFYLFLC